MDTTDWQMLASYFSGELSPQQEQHLLEWVNAHPEHQLAFSHAKQLWQAADQMPPMPSPDTEAEWHTFQKRIAAEEAPLHQTITISKHSMAYYGWAAAAVLLIFLGIGFAFWPKEETLPPLANKLTRFTTTDSVRVVYLPDSSRVWLNQHSELSYATAFGESERRVNLQGEAFFEVRPDATHPFIVQMASANVRVLGTSFDVKDYTGTPTEVSVMKGKVAFYEGNDTLHQYIILYANEGVVFRQNQGQLSKTQSDAQSRLTWRKRNNPMYQQEIKRPSRFLAVTNSWRKNALNQTILEGVIQNNATLAGYASITLRYTVFTKQGKQKVKYFTIHEVILPGQSLLYKRSLMDVLSRPSQVTVEVSAAQSYNNK
ncbi:MAG: FecR domain-containing protein [Bacteroidota bacterium]